MASKSKKWRKQYKKIKRKNLGVISKAAGVVLPLAGAVLLGPAGAALGTAAAAGVGRYGSAAAARGKGKKGREARAAGRKQMQRNIKTGALITGGAIAIGAVGAAAGGTSLVSGVTTTGTLTSAAQIFGGAAKPTAAKDPLPGGTQPDGIGDEFIYDPVRGMVPRNEVPQSSGGATFGPFGELITGLGGKAPSGAKPGDSKVGDVGLPGMGGFGFDSPDQPGGAAGRGMDLPPVILPLATGGIALAMGASPLIALGAAAGVWFLSQRGAADAAAA